MDKTHVKPRHKGRRRSQRVARFILFLCAYAVLSIVLFGSLFAPLLIFLTLMLEGELPIPNRILGLSILSGLVASLASALAVKAAGKSLSFKLPVAAILISAWMLASTFTADRLATYARKDAVKTFNADKMELRPFWQSLRQPRPHFLYTHGIALKDCEVFIWSYRTMSFHPIPSSISKNVMPKDWLKGCAPP